MFLRTAFSKNNPIKFFFAIYLLHTETCLTSNSISQKDYKWSWDGALRSCFQVLNRYKLYVNLTLRFLISARTPLYTHISSTLTGISTIRSFGLQEKINKEFHRCLNYQSEAWILLTTASRWFAQRLDLIVLMYVACAAFAPIVIAPYVCKYS